MEPAIIGAIGGGLFVVANTAVFWIREWRKHHTWNKNGIALMEIKDNIKTVDKKVGYLDEKMGETKVKIAEIKTAVDAQKMQCATTVKRFDKAISDQGQTIIDLAGRKR